MLYMFAPIICYIVQVSQRPGGNPPSPGNPDNPASPAYAPNGLADEMPGLVAAAAAAAAAIAAADAAAELELLGLAPPIMDCNDAAWSGSNAAYVVGGAAPRIPLPAGNPLYGFNPAAPNIC